MNASRHSDKPGGGAPAGPKKLTFDERVARVAAALRLFVADGQVTQLVALDVRRRGERKHTESGFFDSAHLEDMARAALSVTAHAHGVYFTLNPVKPDRLARRANRVDWAGEGELAADKDILCRRWLLIDADPQRDSKVSSTDAEKAAAHGVILEVRDYLGGRGWPAPVLGDSGNGYHLLYRIDLPADEGGLVQRVLLALAQRFDTDAAKIDQSVFNPSRLCKVPGTLARKGDSIPQRPHRRAKLLEVPGDE
jgi:hypothetical protein